jgi:WD40 repeat protein
VRDSNNGELIYQFNCYCTDYIDISPDNKYILYVNSLNRHKTFNIWDIENNKLFKSIDIDINFKSRVNFTNDGTQFYCQGDKFIGYIKEGIKNCRSMVSLVDIETGLENKQYICPIPSTTYDTEYSSNYEYMVVFDKNELYYWKLL